MNAIAKHDGSVAHLPADPMINMIDESEIPY